MPNPILGVFLHALGGLASGSFYVPYRKVQQWSWESYWLVGGFFSWIIAPWVMVALAVPLTAVVQQAPAGTLLGSSPWYALQAVIGLLQEAPAKSLFWSYFFGAMWGIGGLTFGLTMRYLGMSLGMAVALGYCAAFGTLMPPLFNGEMGDVVKTGSGWVILFGVLVCLGGIAITGMAGRAKERELTEEQKKAIIKEFNFVKGILVATFSGVMSASMSYGFAAGKPIAALAVQHGLPPIWQNLPVLVVVLAGGFTTNFIWCVLLNVKNRSGGDYLNGSAPLLNNYVFSALAGTTWYLQFFFYGMGTTKMGKYDFSSWTLHMAFIVVFSSLWGLFLHEWKGASARTKQVFYWGLAVLILSTMIVGYGNYLKTTESKPATVAAGR